jgi:hypothetical protein
MGHRGYENEFAAGSVKTPRLGTWNGRSYRFPRAG